MEEELQMPFDVEALRRSYPALAGRVHDRPLIYLDNAATAQMPLPVMEAVQQIELSRGNVHRGIHTLSEACTAAYESARIETAKFIHAMPEQICFTSGTTDAVNQTADWLRRQLRWGDRVAVTRMEHHSNFVPWQQICRETGAELIILPLTETGELDYAAAERLVRPGIKMMAAAHVSNVLGTVNDIPTLAEMAHAANGLLFVDGAQGICHENVDVTALNCDFYAFSGHKLGAPFGVGALYARKPIMPVRYGGGMVDEVKDDETTFSGAPQSGEAGTPNVSGAVGLAAALEFRQKLPKEWQSWERELMEYLENGLRAMQRICVLGNPRQRSGCISFVVDGASSFDLAVLLDQLGIAVRSGHHCAQPLLRALGEEYALRVSPACYNTREEIDALLHGLETVIPLCIG